CLERRVCYCVLFSSRRRHTRSKRDWSSDVCSSDLTVGCVISYKCLNCNNSLITDNASYCRICGYTLLNKCINPECSSINIPIARSEERRVGKECISRWSQCRYKERPGNCGGELRIM